MACSVNCSGLLSSGVCASLCPRIQASGDPIAPANPFVAAANPIFNGSYAGPLYGPPLWQVDLGATALVDRVVVYGRSGQTYLLQARVGAFDSFRYLGPSVSATSLEGDLLYPLPGNTPCPDVFNTWDVGDTAAAALPRSALCPLRPTGGAPVLLSSLAECGEPCITSSSSVACAAD